MAATETRTDLAAEAEADRAGAADPAPLPQVLRSVATVTVAAYVVMASVLIIIGLAIAEHVPTDRIDEFDRDAAARFEENRTETLNLWSERFDTLADTVPVIIVVASIVALVALTSRSWRLLVVFAVAIPLELLTYVSVTFAVGRPRPDEAMGGLPITPSFPSGHAAMGVVLYGSIAYVVFRHAPRLISAVVAIAAVVVALGVGWARMHAALHYPSDVVFGLLLGAASLGVGVWASRHVDATRPAPEPAASAAHAER